MRIKKWEMYMGNSGKAIKFIHLKNVKLVGIDILALTAVVIMITN